MNGESIIQASGVGLCMLGMSICFFSPQHDTLNHVKFATQSFEHSKHADHRLVFAEWQEKFSVESKRGGRNPFERPERQAHATQTSFHVHHEDRGIAEALIKIHHAKATVLAALVSDRQTGLLSKSGNILADERTNLIWVHDQKTHLKTIVRLMKQLDVPIQQVLIEARIVDVTQDVMQDLGIRFGVAHPNVGQSIFGEVASSHLPMTQQFKVDLPAVASFGQAASLGIALAQLGDNILLDLELSALESEGRAEVIASPRLMAANQQEAVIEAGQEIPYQQSASNGATSVTFKKAALGLRVTPQVTSDGRVLMKLKISQDRPSEQLYNGVPAISTKEIDTNVLVQSGRTIVLGGIYQRNKGNQVVRLPFLGKLLYVGALFRRTSVVRKNEELLIFITPHTLTEEGQPSEH